MITIEAMPATDWSGFFEQHEKAIEKIRQELDTQRTALQQARGAWDAGRQRLEAEIARLQAENEQLRSDRRALLLHVAQGRPDDGFDPASCQVMSWDQFYADITRPQK